MIKKPYLFNIFEELLCYLLNNFRISKRCVRYFEVLKLLYGRILFSFVLTNVSYLETLSKALAVLSKSASCFEVIVIPDVRSQGNLIKLKYPKSGLFIHTSILHTFSS